MKITEQQHIKLGNQLKDFREVMMFEFPKTPKNSCEQRLRRKILKAIDEIRNRLDNMACNDYPENIQCSKFYYGKWR